MNARNKAIIDHGCKIEGVAQFFFEHKKNYPTYKHIKEAYIAKHKISFERLKHNA